MNSVTRKIFVIAAWLIFSTGAVWALVPRPATDDSEYWRWFLFGTVFLAIRIIIDLLIILIICISLAERLTRARIWILSLWTLGLAGPALLVACEEGLKVDPVWARSLKDSLWVFAYPYLFGLLLVLLLALWLEALAGWRSVNRNESARWEKPS